MKNNSNVINYFLCRTLFLGGGLSIIFTYSGKDTYIASFLGILLGVGIIFILSKVANKINVSLNEYLKEKNFLNILIKFIYFLYLIFTIFLVLIIISTFIYSYFLPFTPTFISCLPLIFLACYLNSKNSKYITYVASILMILSLSIIFIKTSLLTSEFEFDKILPILSTSPTNIFKGAFTYAILSTAPFLTMFGEKVEFKESIKYYLIASVANFIVLMSITLTCGDMINVYSYPEYSILRKIRFFDFIENVENFISASWFFDIFICLSISSLKIKELFNTKKRIIPFIIALIIMYGIKNIVSNNFYNSMITYKIFPYIYIAFLIIIPLTIFIKSKFKKNCYHK